MSTLSRLLLPALEKKIPPNGILKSLTVIIILRTFLEMYLERKHSLQYQDVFYLNLLSYIHIYFFWLTLLFTLALLITFCLKINFRPAINLVLFFSPLILIPPLFDFIVTGGRGMHLQYRFELNTFVYDFINCFNPLARLENLSTGVRIEILAATGGIFYIACLVLKKGFFRALLAAFSVYSLIIIFGYLPALYKTAGVDFYALSGQSVTGITRPQKFLFMYLPTALLLLVASAVQLYRQNKEQLKIMLSFLYPSRSLFYLMLLVFGFLFSARQAHLYPQVLNPEDVLKLSAGLISILLLFLYSKLINDIYDVEIDRISNPQRPLAQNFLSPDEARQWSFVWLTISFFLALVTETSFIFYWLFIWAGSYLYSVPPFRIRRYYPLGHLLLAALGLSVFMAGGAIATSYEVYAVLKPKAILPVIFSAFFFLSHIKDLKDMEGDKAGGVYNIFNYLGYPKIVGAGFFSAFTVTLALLAKIIGMLEWWVVLALLIFWGGSLFYILKAKNLKALDRLFLFSLLFSLLLIMVWLSRLSF